MRSLPIPDWALADVYEQCVSNAIPLAKRNRLQGIVSRIRDLERSYQWLAEEGRAHRLEVVNFLEGDAGNVEGDEVYGLYDSRLVAKSSSLRSVYDKLRLSSPGNICPYCGQSPVRTIDHYLPRSKLKFLAVSPFNLIPCCRDCNSEKKEFIALNDSDSLIHPYFDRDLSGIEWLYAEIVETDPLALKFSVIDCDDVIVRRASSHFRVFNLAFYYAHS